MSSAAVTPNNMNGGNKSLSPLEATNPPQGGQQLPQQALQNLQRLLQSQLANVNPIHLQQALQRHQQQQMVDAGRKQLEQMLQQLQVKIITLQLKSSKLLTKKVYLPRCSKNLHFIQIFTF